MCAKTSNLVKTPDTTNVKTNGNAFLGNHKTWHQGDDLLNADYQVPDRGQAINAYPYFKPPPPEIIKLKMVQSWL